MASVFPRRKGFDDDHGIEFRPGRIRGEKPPPSLALWKLKSHKRQGAWKVPREKPSYMQRCAVRIRYTQGGSAGKWKSHGVYIARESKRENKQGFGVIAGQPREDIDVPETLVQWNKASDERFFRVIISPEFGDKIDLEQHVRDTMAGVEIDLSTKLEWCAVVHLNTDNPHVHVALRGRHENGSSLHIPPAYVQEGFRKRAEQCATNQIGYRDEGDVLDAQKRETQQYRFTGLDRILVKRGDRQQGAEWFDVALNPDAKKAGIGRETEMHLIQRCNRLVSMNLAEDLGGCRFRIAANFEGALRKNQETIDRQKMMTAHGHTASDRNLPFRRQRVKELQRLEGRILVHGQDEGKQGSNYAVIETIDGEIVQVPHFRQIGAARKAGNLGVGKYIVIDRLDEGNFKIEEVGEHHTLAADERFMRANAARLAATIPEGAKGWLGDMRRAAVTRTEEQGLKI